MIPPFHRKSPRSANSIAIIPLRWLVVDSRGKVTAREAVEVTFDNERVANCIASRISRWRFPATDEGGVTIIVSPLGG